MAGNGNDPPDKASARKFICCPKKNVGVIVYIICEGVFHSSCIDRQKGAREITKNFIVCGKHGDINLT